jgi:hypothetical protein
MSALFWIDVLDVLHKGVTWCNYALWKVHLVAEMSTFCPFCGPQLDGSPLPKLHMERKLGKHIGKSSSRTNVWVPWLRHVTSMAWLIAPATLRARGSYGVQRGFGEIERQLGEVEEEMMSKLGPVAPLSRPRGSKRKRFLLVYTLWIPLVFFNIAIVSSFRALGCSSWAGMVWPYRGRMQPAAGYMCDDLLVAGDCNIRRCYRLVLLAWLSTRLRPSNFP